MTCEEFEKVVTDLACEFLIEAATRKRALAHAQACSRCAARLQQERALTSALSEAASGELALAPIHVKTALLVAFQQQRMPVSVIAAPASMNESTRRPSRWLMVAAAVLGLVAILVALEVLRQSSRAESPVTLHAAAVAEGTSIKDASPHLNGGATNPSSEENGTKSEDVHPSAVRSDLTNDAPRSMSRRKWRVFRPELARATTRSATTETVTEFIPLTADADTATAMQSGTIVRVELARASLIAMGLPMNAARAQEIVKADLVIGDDGLARAIRLVY